MLETLTNLKNNKIKRATTQQVRGHTADRLKKLLAGLGKTRHRELFLFNPLSSSTYFHAQWYRTTHCE